MGHRAKPLDRIWANCRRTPSGCLEWQGNRDASGRGRIGAGVVGKTLLVHRVAFELVNGPIPEGMEVCHHCDNPPCCEPTHLFTGTRQDNVDDMVAKGRQSPTLANLRPGAGIGIAPRDPASGRFMQVKG